MDDNFNFKVTIFYNKCRQVGLLLNSYIYDASIMLFGQIQMHYYAYCGNFSIVKQFCTNMQLFFKDPKWQRFNLTK